MNPLSIDSKTPTASERFAARQNRLAKCAGILEAMVAIHNSGDTICEPIWRMARAAIIRPPTE